MLLFHINERWQPASVDVLSRNSWWHQGDSSVSQWLSLLPSSSVSIILGLLSLTTAKWLCELPELSACHSHLTRQIHFQGDVSHHAPHPSKKSPTFASNGPSCQLATPVTITRSRISITIFQLHKTFFLCKYNWNYNKRTLEIIGNKKKLIEFQ